MPPRSRGPSSASSTRTTAISSWRTASPRRASIAAEAPLKPRHAPRAMMTAALYEMLCQAYTYVNSHGLPQRLRRGGRTREIRTLTLSYPSGMIQEERKRFAAQGNKAINIFAMTLGKNQRVQAGVEPGHRRGQRRAPHLHLERAADAGPGPAAVVLHLAPGPRQEEAQGGRGRRAGRRRAGGQPPRPARAAASRRCPPPGGAAPQSRKPSATRPTKSASPASTSAAAPPT